MQLSYPSCQADIPARDVYVDALVAKSGHCNSVFNISSLIGKVAASPDGDAVPMPKNIKIEEFANGLHISRRWFTPMYLGMILFCTIWDGFLVFWYYTAFTQQGPILIKLFPIGHLVIGIFITWFTIAGLFNTTTIDADYQRLKIRHKPIPWPGQKTFDVADIDQIYCKEKTRESMNSPNSITYSVFIKSVDGKRKKLISGLHDEDEAIFIEQELERFLGIERHHIKGAIRPRN